MKHGQTSALLELRQMNLAVDLIRMGARATLVRQYCPDISQYKIGRLYVEVTGILSKRGMLPSCEAWFLSYRGTLHSSIFMEYHQKSTLKGGYKLVQAYRNYLDYCWRFELKPILSITRGWILLRYIESEVLMTDRCSKCDWLHPYRLSVQGKPDPCIMCAMPSSVHPENQFLREEIN